MKYGMAPAAWESFVKACGEAGVGTWRAGQTIGNAPASKGFHSKDGTINGKPYCAAVDISDNDLTKTQIRKFLVALAKRGFVAWWRHGSAWAGNTHIHAVYCGVSMKESLFRQCIDFLNDRTGLVGHATESFYTAPPELDRGLARLLRQSNPKLWAKYDDEIPATYRRDEPPKLVLNGKVVKGAYLTNGSWYAQGESLASIVGLMPGTPGLIVPVAATLRGAGYKLTYNQRLATMNRADLRAEKA